MKASGTESQVGPSVRRRGRGRDTETETTVGVVGRERRSFRVEGKHVGRTLQIRIVRRNEDMVCKSFTR